MKLGASTIAAIYKDRVQIELFFKAPKVDLKIKDFVGTSRNADKPRIWTLLIAMLMLRYLQLSSRFGWSLSNLVALPCMDLFTHHDLWIAVLPEIRGMNQRFLSYFSCRQRRPSGSFLTG